MRGPLAALRARWERFGADVQADLYRRATQAQDAAGWTECVVWQVTGEPGPGFPWYQQSWPPPARTPDPERDEREAREFVAAKLRRRADGAIESRWQVGPTLTRRVVRSSPWEHVPVEPEPPTT